MLEGRVCIITGAGRGLGREHALMLASLGASVVVNDLGGSSDGSGADTGAAEAVAAEILAAGGQAVASGHNVVDHQDAGAIVETALDAFGDLHVVVNNAGILRDRMLVSMSEPDFDDVIAVHLRGTFNVTHHAARYWRDCSRAGDGSDRSIINTSSGAGLHGNIGQTSYAAAKAGIAAMTIVNAMELERYGVRANAVAPIARTRLTLQTEWLKEAMAARIFDPGNISPVVACLAAASCPFSGQVFSVYGGTVGIYSGWSIAEEVSTDGRWEVEDLAQAMETLPRSVPVRSQVAMLAEATGGAS